MTTYMQIQAVCFVLTVAAAIALTRRIYYDGMQGQLVWLRRHCIMQASMVLGIAVWATALGYNVHHDALETINEQAETIQQLATGIDHSKGVSNNGTGYSMAFVDDYQTGFDDSPEPSIEVTTPNGTGLSVSLHGRTEWTELRGTDKQFGRRGGSVRHSQTWSGICGDGSASLPIGDGLRRPIY